MPLLETDWYRLERDIFEPCNRMEAFGFPFDTPAAHRLLDALSEAKDQAAGDLQTTFPPQFVPELFVPKRNNKTKGYVAGVAIQRGKLVPYNPNSSQQTAERLQALGVPLTTMTDSGNPSTATAVLATLVDQYPIIQPLLIFKIIEKRIGMLTGEKGWLTVVGSDDRLHTEYFPMGTVTGRASHSPNIAQVPSVVKDNSGNILHGAAGNWGYECRALFHAPAHMVLVGSDMKSLELRCLAHYLDQIGQDGGVFTRLVCDGDVHQQIATQLGISRSMGKRLIYATNYGCGDLKAGSIVAPDEDDEYTVRAIGKEVKASLIDNVVGMRELFDWLSLYPTLLPGLDGRQLYIRKPHAALNTLLQSAGAIICKRWLLMIDQSLQEIGLMPGREYEFAAWIHDEVVIAAQPAWVTVIEQVCLNAAIETGRYYALHCPLAADVHVGHTWAEIH